jgi:hypothetical protein
MERIIDMKRAVITLVSESTGKMLDIDIPTDIPLEQLGERLLTCLDEWIISVPHKNTYRFAKSDNGNEWHLLDKSLSLDEAGVMEGSYLRIESIVSYSTVSDMEKATLFQDVVPLFSEGRE